MRIKVVLQSPTERGRLYPRYDGDADVLEVESLVPRSWSYGIDIDGTIIFDIDSDYRLANFDLLVPKRLWKVSEPFEKKPSAVRKADIKFTQDAIEHQSFSLPKEVQTNRDRTRVLLTFGADVKIAEAVELSEKCIAFIDNECLVGFYLDLS